MSAQSTRAPRSSARIDPVARLIFDVAKPLSKPDPVPQYQPTPLRLGREMTAARAG